MIKRSYLSSDYEQCKKIINDVWNFYDRYHPSQLAELLIDIYINGSLSQSNFAIVIEESNLVQGFIIGRSSNSTNYKNHYSGFLGMLNFAFKMITLKSISLKEKLKYLFVLVQHEKNKYLAVKNRKNEVNLFAVSPMAQGKGYGKLLMEEFVNECKRNKVKRITLDTDKSSNYKFYNHFGFVKIAEFYSKQQEMFSGNDGVSFVYELNLVD